MKYFYMFFVIFSILITNSCSNASAKESHSNKKSSAFDKIDKRDKKLFTQKDRIESYNNSLNKSKKLKASLSANSGSYSGYGSVKKITDNKSQSDRKKKNISKPKMSNSGFSAYSTN